MNKTILITGSTDGIGQLAAYQLAKDGHQLLLHGRNSDKLSRMLNEIKKISGHANIKGFVADFSDLSAVRKMAQAIVDEVGTLDVLVNNAGVFNSPIDKTQGGLDIRFVVNYFAPYILTQILSPLLKQKDDARVINLSSAAQASVSFDALAGTVMLSAKDAYAQSKLALTMWSFDMAKTHHDIGVIAVNPGSLLNTNMVKEAFGQHWSSADKGANILYDLAVSGEYTGVTGKYFDNDKGETRGDFGNAHPDVYDAMKVKQLISVTESIVSS